jgi:hypothetical protein
MTAIPSLDGCEMVPGSFVAVITDDGPELEAACLAGTRFHLAEFAELNECQLVAHRCNTFDKMLAALERVTEESAYADEGGLTMTTYQAVLAAIEAAKILKKNRSCKKCSTFGVR